MPTQPIHTSNLSANNLEFRKDVPFIRTGLGLDQVWFCGGRTAVTILRHGGIGHILHFGNQAMGFSGFFQANAPQSSWEKLFRFCVVINGVAYYPEFNDTTILPSGYSSECSLAGVTFRHELTVLNDAVVQRARILANPEKKTLSLRLVFHGFNGMKSSNRTWGPWKFSAATDALCAKVVDAYTPEECKQIIADKMKDIRPNFAVSDVPYAETHIGIASNLSASHSLTRHSFKHYVSTDAFTDDAAIFLVFNPKRVGLTRRLAELKKTFAAECNGARAAYARRLASSPRISIPSAPVVQSCLANIPPVIDAVEVKDIPGGFRAAMHGYWIWLDPFFNSSAFTYANDGGSLLDMLRLFRSFADPRLGIPALVTTEMKPCLGATFHTQCMFITALYHYHCNTGDIANLRELFPFACWLMDKSLEQEIAGTGMIEGAGLPDFPADQDGHDLCSSGNSIHYQSLRAMARLALEMHADTSMPEYAALATRYDEVAGRCRDSFLLHFWDPEKGYFIDSVSSRNFAKRRHYPVFAIIWITHFAADLLGDHVHEIADFLARNLTRPHGIGGMIPTWDSAYPGDGNQLLAYYPSWSESFYRNVMMLAGRRAQLERYFADVGWFWQQNTIPEGFTYDAENEGFSTDNPGTKQAFGAQAWYCVFFRCIVGLEVDDQGLVLSASCSRRPLSMKGLVVRGKTIAVTVTGKGRKGVISFNGRQLKGARISIPFADLARTNTIVI